MRASRKGRILALFVLALPICVSSRVFAHRPYFTQVEPIILPNGQPGEMRLLHGDGIFFADPTRILVLDQNQRLLARSRRGGPVILLCSPDRNSCVGYDDGSGLVVDSTSFRSGPIVPGLDQDNRSKLSDLESGEESWGFTVRIASVAEIVRAEGAIARTRLRSIALLFVFGATATALVVVGRRRPKGESSAALLGLRIVGSLLRWAGAVIALLASIYAVALVGLTLIAWISGFGSGAGSTLLVRWLMRRQRGSTVHA